jgi:ribonuclease E
MPQVNSQSASHEDVDEDLATEHEFHETLNSESVTTDSDTVTEKPAGRRRRRAASSGIITA